MNQVKFNLIALLLVALLALAGCGGADDSGSGQEPAVTDQADTTSSGGGFSITSDDEAVNEWLQQVSERDPSLESSDGSLEWGLGYLIYYGPVEEIGVDNLIYNALRVHKRMDTGEVPAENLSQADQNLLDITGEMEFDPEVELTEQVAQTPQIRQNILDRITESQADLSPDEALDSNEIVGIVAPPFPEDIGRKYLVYAKETPDAEPTFLGVVIVADATSEGTREPYSFGGWQGLPWLGDAAGPFWEELPAGASGDPTNTEEGRPGVLLIAEDTYREIKEGNFE